MTANHLGHLPGGHHQFNPAMGFGLGVQVLIDVGQDTVPGSLGSFGWSGAATTVCQIDPKTGWCIGCHRTIDEIRDWIISPPDERQKILDALPARRSGSAG